jgi:hypothetical protein
LGAEYTAADGESTVNQGPGWGGGGASVTPDAIGIALDATDATGDGSVRLDAEADTDAPLFSDRSDAFVPPGGSKEVQPVESKIAVKSPSTTKIVGRFNDLPI